MFLKSQHPTPTLYGDEISPPVRFVQMTASHLGIDINFHKIDLFKGENKTDFYTKINPLQKVPVLAVDDETICDSHAIALYLCRLKGAQDLYPKDNLKRSKVQEMLFFNSGLLFPVDSIVFGDYFAGNHVVDSKYIEKWYYLIDQLELKLKENTWLTGDKMSLGDLCCGCTVSSLQLLIPLHDRHTKVSQWLQKLSGLSCFQINSRGLLRLKNFVELMKASSK